MKYLILNLKAFIEKIKTLIQEYNLYKYFIKFIFEINS